MRLFTITMVAVALLAGVVAKQAAAQIGGSPSTSTDQITMSGVVVSSSRTTLLVKTDDAVYQLFALAHDAVKPPTIAVGAKVTVVSSPAGEPGVRIATYIALIGPSSASQPNDSSNVPASIRRLDQSIERDARQYRIGFYTGAGLDPEIIVAGVDAKFGPIFDEISFRPSFEFGFGEVTKLFTLNLEGMYRLPLTPRLSPWSLYVGAGPAFSFVEQSFGRGVDFSNLNFGAGLNLFAGIQFRKGMFLEAKSTVYSIPHLRLMVGYNF
jgi:hypothetical protein